ncbi:MAG: hypothetical protein ACK4TO_03280 [Candidatus Nitrosotenuis sp.]
MFGKRIIRKSEIIVGIKIQNPELQFIIEVCTKSAKTDSGSKITL